jgi:hypothetical protein
MTSPIPTQSRVRFAEWETDATSSGIPFPRSYGYAQSARSIDDSSEPSAERLGQVHLQPARPDSEYTTLDLWSRHFVAESALKFVIQIESPDVGLGAPEDVAVSASSWPRLWRHREPAHVPSEGVFVVAHPVTRLFTKKLRIATASLPSWTPHIVLDERDLESNDD